MNEERFFLDNGFSLLKISSLNELEKYRNDWDTLAANQGSCRPFLCFDWFHLWLRHFLKSNELFILLLFKSEILVAVAPFLRTKGKFKGFKVRKIDLIGNAYSPFRYFLFNESGDEQWEQSLATILDFLVKKETDWDIIDFYSIPEENNYFSILNKAVTGLCLAHHEYLAFGDWFVGNIKCSGEDYFSKLPKKIRKDVSYCHRRLEKMGDLEFKVIKNGDNLDSYMDLYYQVYAKSWQRKEGIGPTFHRDLAAILVKHGWLRLGFLSLDGAVLAAQFWLTCDGTSYILKTVYDQDHKKYSPGKVLTAEMMKYVIDVDRVTFIDYVQGDEPYKKDWTPERRERKGLIVFNSNLKGSFLALIVNQIRPALKKCLVFLKRDGKNIQFIKSQDKSIDGR
ncbi:MAG: GNAT family N-acetyltransferase [Clostridiales bacterium]|nr:GNAT family N-acetyltransferase [Clostridiales bacterium]